MQKLSSAFLDEKIQMMKTYGVSSNAASSSKFDANANVEKVNIATRSNELLKDVFIQINRKLLTDRITEMYDKDLAKQYEQDLENHLLYTHDETSLFPYCVSVNMYPYLIDGLTKLGGESEAPTNLQSFCGSFVNLVFAISAQFAGAVATVEFLMYLEYFVKKQFGEDWYQRLDDVAFVGVQNHTIKEVIEQCIQGIVYTINQPAAARGYQSVFWNISLFDKYYFESLFGEFCFPDDDFTKPEWNGVDAIQRLFLTWFNKEREKKILTFPVVTCALLTENNRCKDDEFTKYLAKEMSEGNSFFVYMSESADSLASCCRLRNEVNDTSFSYSLGAGGVATGSVNVMTLNVNRLVQKNAGNVLGSLEEIVKRIHKYQIAYRSLVEDDLKNGLLTVYSAGFISLDKQFSTIGINGFVEAAEFLNIDITPNESYFDFCKQILGTIYKLNREATKETGVKFNTEFVPAENLGVKNAKWDKQDGLSVERDVYNSYFYIVENDTNPLDKFILHGKDVIQYLDGGSALHLNLDVPLPAEKYYGLFQIAATSGANYWTVNVKNTICNDCGHIEKRPTASCVACGSSDVDGATRVIGYIKRISSFSNARQKEANIRFYAKETK